MESEKHLQIYTVTSPSLTHTPSFLHSCAQVESQLCSAHEEVRALKEVTEERNSELQVSQHTLTHTQPVCAFSHLPPTHPHRPCGIASRG